MELIDIPKRFRDLLVEVQKTQPEAIIAGGCLRDEFCAKPHKDVDVFCEAMPSFFSLSGNNQLPFEYEGMKYVKAVAGTRWQDLQVNLIVTEPVTPTALIESFDFGLCQIAFDGKEIIKTFAFDWDYKQSRFTMMHGDRFLRSLSRFNRINKRYGHDLFIHENCEIIHKKHIDEGVKF